VLTRAAARAVLLDLDGTLLDTVHDLAWAAARMRDRLGMPPLDERAIRAFIGNGIGVLVDRVLAGERDGAPPEPDVKRRALAIYEEEYAAALTRSSVCFPGVVEGLDILRERGLRLACVTNKAERFTLPLLRHAALLPYLDLVVSGDSLPRKKPDPLPLVHAATTLGASIDDTILIGDSENDAQAARAAGCRFVAVDYGYRHGGDAESLGADRVVSSLADAALFIENSVSAS
jgi:phosphoglycolate phosphatase